jgi:hypothetical protein
MRGTLIPVRCKRLGGGLRATQHDRNRMILPTDCLLELRRIGILLEFYYPVLPKGEEVSELCVNLLPALLVRAAVVSVPDHEI